jgi:HD-GYP domain-containing protein (c-di-GMP phosphodiesterase class II)
MSDNNVNRNKLAAVSIELLFDGMVVEEDVYDSTAAVLLIGRGTRLTTETISKIRKLNAGGDLIYVSGDTYKTLIERRPPPVPAIRKELEESTGYTAVKDVTQKLLDEVAHSQIVQQETIHSISSDLSNKLEVSSPATVLSLINALAPVDEYFQRHCINVSLLNGLFGRWLGLPKADVDHLVLVGLVHDCGKALIPPQVLNAPRRLTGVEFEVIKMHTVYSYELLAKFPEPVRLASRHHHEKLAGSGYPDRLMSDRISLQARITAISDIYDAMVSQRAYKSPRSPFSIMAMLPTLCGSELDNGLVNVFNQKMPFELMNKLVMMSDGTVGVVRSFDPSDIEYPVIEVNGRALKSGAKWHCLSMHTEEKQ